MQESGYRVNSTYSACGKLSTIDIGAVCVYQDFGMAQINYKTADYYKFNIKKLLKDEKYSINAGAKVLSWFYKTYANREPKKWYSRYNCGTKRSVNRRTCKVYKSRVDRWMK